MTSQITDSNQQSADEKGLADYVKKKVEDVRSSGNRIAHEGVWMTNTAYLLGFDSVYYDTSNRRFRSLDGASGAGLRRNRVFENLILPAVQNRQARLCKQAPKFEIRPEDNSNEAKEAARLGREVLLQLWDDCEINLKRLPLTMWLQQCGHAYMHVSFDDELGQPLMDPTTNSLVGYEGKITVEPVSAFEIFPDPLATTLDEAQWIVRAKVRKLDYFRTRYPERGALVRSEGAWLLSIQYEQRIQSLTNSGISSANSSVQMENAAIELTYYEKRSRKHPNGRHVIVANGVILKDGPLPYGGEIPYAKFDDVLIAGKYYSEATITHARPLQDQYNRTLTRRAKWTNQLLAGKWSAARGHGLSAESLNDASGEVIEYDPVPNAAPPSAVQVPTIPAYAYTETDQLKKSLYDIFGLSEVSRGQLPSASIPAVGMQLLIEQDETRIGIEIEQHEHAYARIGTLMLLCASRNFKTDRNLAEKNANNDLIIKKYSGNDLPERPDVKVVRGSTVPTSSTLRRQEVMNAFTNGLLGSPQDPLVRERVLEMMEFGNSDGLWEDEALDSNQARRDLLTIEQNQMPVIDKFDNHAYLIRKLNNYRKSDKFLEMPPEQQQLLLKVRDMRAEALAHLANPQLGQMEANVQDGLSAIEGEPLLDHLEDPHAAAQEAPAIPQPA